jgi:hypothetical protein
MIRLILEVACSALFALCFFILMISLTMRVVEWTS